MTDFQPSLNDSLRRRLSSLKETYALDQAEISPLKSPLSIGFYEKWLSRNFHGDMDYLSHHLPFKQNPQLLGAQLRSVISVAQSYFPAPRPAPQVSPARIALYARNEDYHHWLKEKLRQIIENLQADFPGHTFMPYVDSGPLLERDLAYQSGLGWFGKNSCLIHPEHGSLFFVAEILTSITLEEPSAIEPLPDFCGKCRRCMDICPTGALVEPKVLRADRCISYLTIESKTVPEPELRQKIGDWFFGCDLCQTVCPWNEKVFRQRGLAPSSDTSTAPQLPLGETARHELVSYFRFLLTASHKKIQKHHLGSPLSRAGAKGLKRNALIVIANRGLHELSAEVLGVTTEDLRELSLWTYNQLTRTH